MKITAFILSFVMLSNSLNIHISDIVNLNDLIEHAQYHNQQYNDGFFTFLAKHYGKIDHKHQNQEQEKEHEKLPFQHCTQTSSVQLNVIFFHIEIPDLTHPFSEENQNNFGYKNFHPVSFVGDILQPPRLA